MRNRVGRLAVTGFLAVILGVPVALGTASGPSARTGNLIRNGGAELGPAVSDDSSSVTSIPGWVKTGEFTVVKYGSPGGFPDATVASAVKGGKNFFAGGPANPDSGATQDIDVARFAAAIDRGTRTATLAGELGGFSGQRDSLTVLATFRDASGHALGLVRIGPVTSAQRKGTTSLIARTATAKVPRKTRSVNLSIRAVRTDGSYNDGYADNLTLTFGP